MRGRYTISIDEQEIRDIVNAITQRHPDAEFKTGEIYPTNPAPVLLAGQDDIRPDVAVWGFPNFRSKSGVIINARAETALDKKSFRESLLSRRCVIPSTGFFEWAKDAKKTKIPVPRNWESTVVYGRILQRVWRGTAVCDPHHGRKPVCQRYPQPNAGYRVSAGDRRLDPE